MSSVALGYSPPEPWISGYMQRFRASLSELNPEGLVDVLRVLSSANALPSHQWLTDFEADLQRRYAMPHDVCIEPYLEQSADSAHPAFAAGHYEAPRMC